MFQFVFGYCDKHHYQSPFQVGGKGLFWLTGYSSSPREAKTRMWRQNVKSRPQRMLLSGLFIWLPQLPTLLVYSTSLSSRHTWLGMIPPTVDWAVLCQLTVKKMPHRLFLRPIRWRQFFPGNSSLCQGDETKNRGILWDCFSPPTFM